MKDEEGEGLGGTYTTSFLTFREIILNKGGKLKYLQNEDCIKKKSMDVNNNVITQKDSINQFVLKGKENHIVIRVGGPKSESCVHLIPI